jgi:K+-transporting ATPase KdpF subunit
LLPPFYRNEPCDLKEGSSDLLRPDRQVLYGIFISLGHLLTSPSLRFTPINCHIGGTSKAGKGVTMTLGLIAAVFLLGYLVYTLVRPEKF